MDLPRFNTFIIETVAGQGWLTPEQISQVQDVLRRDANISALDIMQQLSMIGAEHVVWLEQAVAREEAPVEIGHPAGLVFQPPGVETVLADDGALEHLHDYLKLGKMHDASDVHLGTESPPIMRRFGSLAPLWENAPKLTAAQTERILFKFLTPSQLDHLREHGDLDFCYESGNLGRFRTSVVRQRLGYDGVFRIIKNKVRSMDELGLPEHLKSLTKFHNGLVLITGSVGSGKSTTLAAFVEEINRDRHDHIITLEDPIEYVFQPQGCQVTQREVHTHTHSFAAALRAALREDPDVIMVGEMRDLETIQLAITASETGHLVLGTLHTSNAARTLDRLLDVFPIEQQAQIRTMVSGSLRGIISQQLVPRADGQGRALAMEVLINSPAAAALIRDGKTYMLPGVMQTGKKIGCKLMDDSLLTLLESSVITAQEAFDRADQKGLFKNYIAR